MCLLLLQEESLSWAELPKGKNKQTNKKNKKQNSEFCNQGKRGPIYCLTSGAVQYTGKREYIVEMLVTQSCPTVCNSMDCSWPGFCPWHSPGKNTGVGSHSLV